MELGVNLLNQILEGSFQHSGEGSAHDLVRHSLQVHQGLERLQVVQWILKSIVGLQLWHTKLRWKGERSDRCHEW